MSVSIHPLYEGTFSVGTDKIFHPIAKTDRAHRGALKVSIHPFLIKSEDGVLSLVIGQDGVALIERSLL